MSLRSFNPAFKQLFADRKPMRLHIHEMLNPHTVQQVLDGMRLKKLYPDGSKLDIIECNPGNGVFSSMVNYDLKPRNHILIESRTKLQQHWKKDLQALQGITGNKENFTLYPRDPYDWQTYLDLTDKDKIIQPVTKSYDQVHDELLLIANWCYDRGEKIVAQWIGCCGDRNWLQKYGKVRVICMAPSKTVSKFLSEPGFGKRNRTAMKRELFTDSKLLAIIANSANLPGEGYDPRVLIRDQPVAAYDNSIPKSTEMGIFEFYPSGMTTDAIAEMEYLLSPMYMNRSTPLRQILPKIVSGGEGMAESLPHDLLDRSPREFTTEDILAIAHAYDKWPFKPDYVDTIQLDEIDESQF
ncbi:uncharacterized protein SPAPADRAFT_136286 [Spathaspora passalidarum NRRL Y-27907]|uniref:rRNA adenine N(6)-methyltransferase n=1 Tax=Spathaspora passalidarum (strain NRRL Y-27907 / 11-Y1) TaxID=619300 RepID=G3ALN1_SPAPN|nr:uncharacterized protein SPAPADRAFT_136286 [Spathaspora passalidarum NRRL Y-27907]EGW33274.1 hypothetical protein SPAPADRAFT_136286 [Spathaspora passalidarum NRRL Y-27907]